MAGAPPYFLDSLRRFDHPFRIGDVLGLHPDLSRETIRVYLSMATSDGVLDRVGLGVYQMAEPLTEVVPSYPPLEKLQANVLPNVWRHLVVWSDEDVAGFVHDAIMSPFLVVESPRKAINTIQQVLERNGTWTVRLKNRRHLAFVIRDLSSQSRDSGEGPVVLIPNEGLAATHVSEFGYHVPDPERLFLDFLGDDPAAIDYLVEAAPRHGLDPIRLLKAASPRKRTGEVASMLTTVIALRPDHPIRHQLERRWPWIERLP